MSNNTTTKVDHSPHSILVATVDIILSLFLTVVYVPCMYVILRNQKFYKLASFKFIILLAIFDLLGLLTTGPVTAIYQIRNELPPTDSKIWGAIGFSTWFGYVITIAFLSVERFFKIWIPTIWYRLYEGFVIYIWLMTPTAYAIAMFIALMINDQCLYDPSGFSWYYNESPIKNFVQIMDITLGQSIPTVMIIIYTSIFIRFYKMNQSTSDGSNKLERQILYQSFWTSTMVAAVVVTFNGVPLISANKWAFWFCHLIWLINCGINGVIYLTFNKSMRDAVIALVKNKSLDKTTVAGTNAKPQVWTVGANVTLDTAK